MSDLYSEIVWYKYEKYILWEKSTLDFAPRGCFLDTERNFVYWRDFPDFSLWEQDLREEGDPAAAEQVKNGEIPAEDKTIVNTKVFRPLCKQSNCMHSIWRCRTYICVNYCYLIETCSELLFKKVPLFVGYWAIV